MKPIFLWLLLLLGLPAGATEDLQQQVRCRELVFDAGNVSPEPPPAEVRALLDEEVDCGG